MLFLNFKEVKKIVITLMQTILGYMAMDGMRYKIYNFYKIENSSNSHFFNIT